MLELLARFQELDLKAVNEAFLSLIFQKYHIIQGNDLLEKIKTITQKKAFSKLESFVLFTVQRLTIGSSCVFNKIKSMKEIIQTLTEDEIKKANVQELMEFGASINRRNMHLMITTYDLFMMISLQEILAFRRMVKLVRKHIEILPKEDLRKMAILSQLQTTNDIEPNHHVRKVQQAVQKTYYVGYSKNPSPLLDFGFSKSSSSEVHQMNLIPASGPIPDQNKNDVDMSQLIDNDDTKSLLSQPSFNFIFSRPHKLSEDASSLFNF